MSERAHVFIFSQGDTPMKKLLLSSVVAGAVAALAYNKRRKRFELDTLKRRSSNLLDQVEKYGRELHLIR
jgi:hypothetical protein